MQKDRVALAVLSVMVFVIFILQIVNSANLSRVTDRLNQLPVFRAVPYESIEGTRDTLRGYLLRPDSDSLGVGN